MSGLSPHSTYHFRIVATNADGTSYGEDVTFTTAVPHFGRCVKVPAEHEAVSKVYHGGFTTSNCTSASPTHTGEYEWQAGVGKAGFTSTGGTVELFETPAERE